MRRVDAQVDGHRGDAFVLACDTVRLRVNLLPHLIEVRELLPLAVQELSIFWESAWTSMNGRNARL